MFDSIILRTSNSDGSLSAGKIAESLLYYRKTHLFLSRHSLFGLIDQLGITTLIELLSRPEVSAEFCDDITSVITDDAGTYKERHFLGYAKIVADKNQREYKSPLEKLEYDFREEMRASTEVKKLLTFIDKKIPFRDLGSDHFIKGGSTFSNNVFKDPAHLKGLVREAVSNLIGGYLLDENYRFEIYPTDDNRHIVLADINWNQINISRKSINPKLEEVSIRFVLSRIHEANTELILASHYDGDFITNENSSKLIQFTNAEILKKTNRNLDQIETFQEHVLYGLPDIPDYIDNRKKSLDDFFKIVDKAQEFKNWLGKVSPDDKILGEYIQELRKIDKFEYAENKVMRYVFNLWLSFYNPPAGLAATFFEAFLLERYAKKWRPNHFVDNTLIPFMKN